MGKQIDMSRFDTDAAIAAFTADLSAVEGGEEPSNVIRFADKIGARPAATPVQGGPMIVNANAAKWSLTPLADIDDTPIQWAVQGIIPQHGLTVIFGKPKSGKSFVAIDLAAAIATGRDWHGHPVQQGKVIYIAGEGRFGMRARFAAWAEHSGADPMQNVLLSSGRAIITPTAVADIIPVIAAQGAPRLIIIDTLKRNFHGDENAQKDMGAFIAGCDRLREFFPDTAILIVHHSGHGNEDRAMGSINLLAAADAEWRVSKGTGGTMEFACTAMKDAEEPDPMGFSLESVGDSLVPVSSGKPVKKVSKSSAIKREGETALDAWILVQDFIGPEGLEDKPWRDEFYRLWGKDADANRQAFGRARKQLVEAGRLNSNAAPYIMTVTA